MKGDRGKSQKEEEKRSQGDEEMATDHINSLGQRRRWDERFSIAPPCGLRVGGYRIEWEYELGIHSGFGDLFGGVCLRAVGYARTIAGGHSYEGGCGAEGRGRRKRQE